MGIFGLVIPEEYGGLGESLLTYALCVEEIARGWMSVSGIVNTHFIVAYMIMQHGTDEQKAKYLPRMATGEIRGAFSMSEPHCGSDVAAITSKAVPNGEGGYTLNGAEDVADQRWLVHAGRRAGAHRRRRPRGRLGLQEDVDVPHREAGRVRRGPARAEHPRQDRQDGLQGRRHDRADHGQLPARRRRAARRGARQGLLPDDGRRRGRPRERRRPRVRGLRSVPSSSASSTPSSARRSASRSPSTRPWPSGWPTWPSRSRPRTR